MQFEKEIKKNKDRFTPLNFLLEKRSIYIKEGMPIRQLRRYGYRQHLGAAEHRTTEERKGIFGYMVNILIG